MKSTETLLVELANILGCKRSDIDTKPEEVKILVAWLEEIQHDAELSGYEKGLRDSASLCDAIKNESGVGNMSPQAIVADMCKVSILSKLKTVDSKLTPKSPTTGEQTIA